MPVNLTDANTWTATIQSLQDNVDPVNQANLTTTAQGLANRTKYLQQECEVSGVLAVRFGTFAAMQALTGMTTGQAFWSQSTGAAGTSQGLYFFNASSTATADGTRVVTATGGGRWLLELDGISNTVPGYVYIASGSPTVGQVVSVTGTSPTTYGFGSAPASIVFRSRGVITSNVATLSSFTVAGGDGVTFVAGDNVLLVNQSTASQNGLYTVGTVTTGTAPLTRATGWSTGSVYPESVVNVSEGTAWAHSTWRVSTQGAITVDTTGVALYPERVKGSINCTGNPQTVGSLWVLAGATVNVTYAGGSATQAGVNTITAGAGSGSFQITIAATGLHQYVLQNFS